MQTSPRPLTHRPSVSNVAHAGSPLSSSLSNGLASRIPHARTGSHSVIGASLNSGHRVNRRKSMTSPGANVAAVAAMIQEADALPAGGLATNARRTTLAKAGGNAVSSSLGTLPRGTSAMAAALATAGTANGLMASLPLLSPPASLPTRRFVTADGSAIDDDLNDMSDGDVEPASLDASSLAFEMARVRRASDGQPLKEGRRSSRLELRCQQCGKGYKHSSCLSKHLYVCTCP